MAKGYKRHLSNYILDKGLQLRYVAAVTVVSVLLFGALGYMAYQQESAASRNIISTLEDTDYDAELKAQIVEQLTSTDQGLVLTMVIAGLGMVFALSFYLIVLTHKVAGPLFKVSKYFDEMAEGRLSQVWPLRKGDQLRDFYEKFKDMHDTLRARQSADIAALGKFIDACDAADLGGPGEFGHKLDEAKSHRAARDRQLA